MTDHQGQIIAPATMERVPVFVSTIILHSLAYGGFDVMDDDNLVTTLSALIQVSKALMGMVRMVH